jgi:hypothetical protein
MAWCGVIKGREDSQAVAATFVQVGREVNPAATVSQVKNRYLYLS